MRAQQDRTPDGDRHADDGDAAQREGQRAGRGDDADQRRAGDEAGVAQGTDGGQVRALPPGVGARPDGGVEDGGKHGGAGAGEQQAAEGDSRRRGERNNQHACGQGPAAGGHDQVVGPPDQSPGQATDGHGAGEHRRSEPADGGRGTEPPLQVQRAPGLDGILGKEGPRGQDPNAEQDRGQPRTGSGRGLPVDVDPPVVGLGEPDNHDEDGDGAKDRQRPRTGLPGHAGAGAADEHPDGEGAVPDAHEPAGLEPLPGRGGGVGGDVQRAGRETEQDQRPDERGQRPGERRDRQDEREQHETDGQHPPGTEPVDEPAGDGHDRHGRQGDGGERETQLAVTDPGPLADRGQHGGPGAPERTEDDERQKQPPPLAGCGPGQRDCEIHEECRSA